MCTTYFKNYIKTEEFPLPINTLLLKYLFLDVLGTVDFIDKTDGTVIFRTCDKEKNKVVVQLGTCDPNRALKIAKLM